jgi:threonine synthase
VMAQLEGLSMEPAAAVACAGLIQMIQERLIHPNEVVIVNASGHTFPVEKQILENEIVKGHTRVQELEKEVVEGTKPEAISLRKEGLLTALERLDDRVQSVVIVEDEPDARVLLRRILQHKRKYKIYEASDGVSGITLIRSERPDLVLLDLMIPELDGFSVLDTLKADQELRDIPVIVITAKDLTSEDYQRLSGRVESLLQKGMFMEEELFESISDALEQTTDFGG